MNSPLPEASVIATANPWYREPMVLMVIAIPLIAIIVSFTMLTVAIITFDGVVVDDYYKQGKEINQVLHRDDEARLLDIGAGVRFHLAQVTIDMSSKGNILWPEVLSLRILHPTQAGKDVVIELDRQQGQHYVGAAPVFRDGDWIVQIETSQWRLSGRALLTDESQFELDSKGMTVE